jgi:glyoxylate utilization-related uncharacterized protein
VEERILALGFHGPYRQNHPDLTEIFYVLEGGLLLQIGDLVERARARSFVFCPAGCVRAFRAAGTEPARVLIIALPPAPMEGYFRALAKLSREAGEAEWDVLGNKWGNIMVGPPLEGDE